MYFSFEIAFYSTENVERTRQVVISHERRDVTAVTSK